MRVRGETRMERLRRRRSLVCRIFLGLLLLCFVGEGGSVGCSGAILGGLIGILVRRWMGVGLLCGLCRIYSRASRSASLF